MPALKTNQSGSYGSGTIGLFVQALELGIVISQFWTFWTRCDREGVWVKVIVSYVTVVSIFQTAGALYSFWTVVVINYGTWTGMPWPDGIQPVVTALLAVPVQSYLIWRCWTILDRRRCVLIIFGTVVVSYFILSILAMVTVFNVSFNMATNPGPADLAGQHTRQFSGTYIASLVLSATLDATLTSILLNFLFRKKNQIYSQDMIKRVNGMIALVWEAALPPCLCALAALFAYIYLVINAGMGYWDLAFQDVLGKLYAISLLITLNGHAEVVVDLQARRPNRGAENGHVHEMNIRETRATALSTEVWPEWTTSSVETRCST